jgi:hypothetical protein
VLALAAFAAAGAGCSRADRTADGTNISAPATVGVGAPRWERLTADGIASAMGFEGELHLERATPVPAQGEQRAVEGWRLTGPAKAWPDVLIQLLHTDTPWRETYRTLAAAARPDAQASAVSSSVSLAGGRVGVVLGVPTARGVAYEAMMPTDHTEEFVVVTVSPGGSTVQGQPPLRWTATLAGAVDRLLFGQ